MNKLEDFILEIDQFLNKAQCENLIDIYNYVDNCGMTFPRIKHSSHDIDDSAVFLHEAPNNDFTYDLLENIGLQSRFFLEKFWEEAYFYYAKKYSILKNMNHHSVQALKLQKSLPGQGYHIWHCESETSNSFRRILTFIVYLNDVEEGGETEFLYYPKRIKPEQGKLVLFPGFFTHAHRGNQPLSGVKYILTGWVFFN